VTSDLKEHGVTAIDLSQQAADLLEAARDAHSGRAAHLLIGGPESLMTQTVIALRSGAVLGEHQNPGQATLWVLEGEVELIAGEERLSASAGDLVEIPPMRHSLEAATDAAVVLTAVKLGEHTD
jgi:quercetin dioxygenase-like cupin family protein